MRLSTLSLFASLLMGASVAWAQTDSADRPLPPNPSQELSPADATDGVTTSAGPSSTGYSAWQSPPGYGGYGAYGGYGGYGGWQNPCCGPWEGYCDHHGCGGCNRCCKPSLRCRLKALRNKLASCLSRCRSCSGSCCGECTSCCHGGDTPDYHGDLPLNVHDQEAIPAAPQSDTLPMPPPEPSSYDSSDNQATSRATPVAKRQYNMPRMKTAKSRKSRR